MPLNKEEIEILIENGWLMVCESPLEFERDAQFSGGVHMLYSEEDQREELENIRKSKEFYDTVIAPKIKPYTKQSITFEGIPSGNGECFCWKVDKDTFIRFRGEDDYNLLVDMDALDDMFIYPEQFFPDKKNYKITITLEEI